MARKSHKFRHERCGVPGHGRHFGRRCGRCVAKAQEELHNMITSAMRALPIDPAFLTGAREEAAEVRERIRAYEGRCPV